jgi:hypothetical protein
MSQHYQEPAFPTFPMQTALGKTVVAFGISKLEFMTAMVYIAHGGRLVPDAAIQTAAEIIDGCCKYTGSSDNETNNNNVIQLS